MVALAQALHLGMDYAMQIHTPLMHLTKAQTVFLAQEVGAMTALRYSHTCYEGAFPRVGCVLPVCCVRAVLPKPVWSTRCWNGPPPS